MENMKQIPTLCAIISLLCIRLHGVSAQVLPEHIDEVGINDENIMLNGCASSGLISPRKAEFNNIDPANLRPIDYCIATETFREACLNDNVCDFTKTVFRGESGNNCTNQVAGRFAYDCPSVSGTAMEDIDREMRGDDLISPNFPNYPETDAEARCIIKQNNEETFIMDTFEAWATFNDNVNTPTSMNSQLHMFGIASDANITMENKVISRFSRFVNLTTFIGKEVEEIRISYSSTPNNLKFTLKFSASTNVRVCCVSNDTWPECEGPLPVIQPTKSTSKAGMPPWHVWVIVAGAIILIIPMIIIEIKYHGITKLFGKKQGKAKPNLNPNSNSVENGTAPNKQTLSKTEISAPYAQQEEVDTPNLLPKQPTDHANGANAAEVSDHNQGLTSLNKKPVATPRKAQTRAANYPDTKTRL